jgi:hypothetical protein
VASFCAPQLQPKDFLAFPKTAINKGKVKKKKMQEINLCYATAAIAEVVFKFKTAFSCKFYCLKVVTTKSNTYLK